MRNNLIPHNLVDLSLLPLEVEKQELENLMNLTWPLLDDEFVHFMNNPSQGKEVNSSVYESLDEVFAMLVKETDTMGSDDTKENWKEFDSWLDENLRVCLSPIGSKDRYVPVTENISDEE